jgi:hypothetical protein
MGQSGLWRDVLGAKTIGQFSINLGGDRGFERSSEAVFFLGQFETVGGGAEIGGASESLIEDHLVVLKTNDSPKLGLGSDTTTTGAASMVGRHGTESSGTESSGTESSGTESSGTELSGVPREKVPRESDLTLRLSELELGLWGEGLLGKGLLGEGLLGEGLLGEGLLGEGYM